MHHKSIKLAILDLIKSLELYQHMCKDGGIEKKNR